MNNNFYPQHHSCYKTETQHLPKSHILSPSPASGNLHPSFSLSLSLWMKARYTGCGSGIRQSSLTVVSSFSHSTWHPQCSSLHSIGQNLLLCVLNFQLSVSAMLFSLFTHLLMDTGCSTFVWNTAAVTTSSAHDCKGLLSILWLLWFHFCYCDKNIPTKRQYKEGKGSFGLWFHVAVHFHGEVKVGIYTITLAAESRRINTDPCLNAGSQLVFSSLILFMTTMPKEWCHSWWAGSFYMS